MPQGDPSGYSDPNLDAAAEAFSDSEGYSYRETPGGIEVVSAPDGNDTLVGIIFPLESTMAKAVMMERDNPGQFAAMFLTKPDMPGEMPMDALPDPELSSPMAGGEGFKALRLGAARKALGIPDSSGDSEVEAVEESVSKLSGKPKKSGKIKKEEELEVTP